MRLIPILLLILLIGCSDSEPEPIDRAEVEATIRAEVAQQSNQAQQMLSPDPTPTPNVEAAQESNHEGASPPQVVAARERLASDLAVPEANLIVISLEPIDWADTSLGCPIPGYMYAQVITSGYKVAFEHGGMSYVVHTDQDGTNTARCDVISSPTPTSTGICTLTGGEVVEQGWTGKDTGSNDCNQCMCLGAGLACTKMACPPPKPTPDTLQTVSPKPSRQSGRPEDKYACAINSEGYCIFSGIPHEAGLKPNTEEIVDRNGTFLFFMHEAVAVNSSGKILEARGTPAFNGDKLVKHSKDGMTDDEKAFHRVMAIMFLIRNALMYDIGDVSQATWDELVSELKLRGIKDKTFTDGATPRDNYYGRQGIFELATNPEGKDIHHPVMKFLEEAGLYLLCNVTSNEFNKMLKDTHPEGHDPCKDAGITLKVPFRT